MTTDERDAIFTYLEDLEIEASKAYHSNVVKIAFQCTEGYALMAVLVDDYKTVKKNVKNMFINFLIDCDNEQIKSLKL